MAVVAFFVFSLLYLTPGDPAAVIAGDAATSDDIRRIRANLGLDEPFLVRFGGWVWGLLHGDLGTSIFTNLPVTRLIAQRVEPTVALTLCTLLIAVAIAVPLGVIAAAKVGTWIDRSVMAFSVLGFSVPVFVLAYILILTFSIELDWLPVQGYRNFDEGVWEWLRHLILPSIALGHCVHGADRAHHARHDARRAGAGLRAHRASQGTCPAFSADDARAQKCRRSDHDDRRNRHCATDQRRDCH